MMVGALLRRRVVPQVHVLKNLQSLATGSYTFVGSAEAEDKITNSISKELLVAAIDDQQAESLEIRGAASFRWRDAEYVMDYWAEKITTRILQLQRKSSVA